MRVLALREADIQAAGRLPATGPSSHNGPWLRRHNSARPCPEDKGFPPGPKTTHRVHFVGHPPAVEPGLVNAAHRSMAADKPWLRSCLGWKNPKKIPSAKRRGRNWHWPRSPTIRANSLLGWEAQSNRFHPPSSLGNLSIVWRQRLMLFPM